MKYISKKTLTIPKIKVTKVVILAFPSGVIKPIVLTTPTNFKGKTQTKTLLIKTNFSLSKSDIKTSINKGKVIYKDIDKITPIKNTTPRVFLKYE